MSPLFVAGSLAAAVFGFFLPPLLERVVARKSRAKNEDAPVLSNGFRIGARIAFLLLFGIGSLAVLGLCPLPFPASLELLATLFLGLCMVYVDQRIRIIPDELTLAYLVVALIFRLIEGSWANLWNHALGAALTLVLFTVAALLTGRGSVGMGDVKLVAVIGFSAGFPGTVYALLVAAISMGLFGAIGILLKKLTLKSKLPFAAFLMLGAFASKSFELIMLI